MISKCVLRWVMEYKLHEQKYLKSEQYLLSDVGHFR